MATKLVMGVSIWTVVSISAVFCRPPSPTLGSLDTDDDLELASNKDAHLFDLFCDPCSPGWGVKSICNGSNNTVCIPCPSGTWSPKRPHFRPCAPCSKCGNGLYEDIPCTNTRDTKCDSCSNVKGHFNEDYKKKCDWRQVPDTLKSASDEDEYSEESEDGMEDQMRTGPTRISVDNGNKEVDIRRGENGKDTERPIFDEAAIRKRIMDKLKELANKLENKPWRDTETSSEEEESDEDGDQPLYPHIIRPLPRVMPGLVKPVIIEESWEEDTLEPRENKIEVNYPPSYHSYPIDAMMHSEQERRKGVMLMTVTALTVILAVGFIVIYSIIYRKGQRSHYGTVSQVNLSPEDQEIVRKSANRLEEIEKPVKRFHFGPSGYKPLIEENTNESLCITENPLESYLDDKTKNGLTDEKPPNKM